MIDIREQEIGTFLDELAGGGATPGGGAAAALGGAMAAALLTMVTNLTLGRKKFADVSEEMTRIGQRTEEIREEMTNLAQLDQHVFERVMASYRLPKETERQKASRNAAIQNALMDATQVPLKVAKQAAELFEYAPTLAEKGNRNAVSDAGVGLLMAEAALHGALMNVRINLALIDDEAFVSGIDHEVSRITADLDQRRHETLQTVKAALEG